MDVDVAYRLTSRTSAVETHVDALHSWQSDHLEGNRTHQFEQLTPFIWSEFLDAFDMTNQNHESVAFRRGESVFERNHLLSGSVLQLAAKRTLSGASHMTRV